MPSPLPGLFRPTLPSNAIMPAVGALGALVMPYNLFFHSAVVNSKWVEAAGKQGGNGVGTVGRAEDGATLHKGRLKGRAVRRRGEGGGGLYMQRYMVAAVLQWRCESQRRVP